jgi:hypothetical protein
MEQPQKETMVLLKVMLTASSDRYASCRASSMFRNAIGEWHDVDGFDKNVCMNGYAVFSHSLSPWVMGPILVLKEALLAKMHVRSCDDGWMLRCWVCWARVQSMPYRESRT